MQTYNAVAEYDKETKSKNIQGNIPRRIYNRAMANLVNGIVSMPEMRVANDPGITPRMQGWSVLDESKKTALINELSYDEVVCGIRMEAENVGSSYVLNLLVNKKMQYEDGVPHEEAIDKSE